MPSSGLGRHLHACGIMHTPRDKHTKYNLFTFLFSWWEHYGFSESWVKHCWNKRGEPTKQIFCPRQLYCVGILLVTSQLGHSRATKHRDNSETLYLLENFGELRSKRAFPRWGRHPAWEAVQVPISPKAATEWSILIRLSSESVLTNHCDSEPLAHHQKLTGMFASN